MMSKKSMIICDRCGKEVPHNVGKRFYHQTVILFDRFCLWEGLEDRLDLCDDCSNEFRKWLKKEVQIIMELGYEKDIEDVYTWALDHMEGCDEPEWTMYSQIVAAIENYWMKKFKFKLKNVVDNKLNDLVGNAIEDTIAEMPNALKMLEDSQKGIDMAIYKLEFDWWTVEDEDKPWYEQEQRVYYFTHAEDALDFVDRVVWNEAAYVSMGSPINAYLYKFTESRQYDERDCRYIAAWHDIDKRVR